MKLRPASDRPAYPAGGAPYPTIPPTRSYSLAAGLRKEGSPSMRTAGQPLKGKTALVLNSLSVEAGLIQKWLEAEGYQVEVVAEKMGFEAKVERETPSLIVMAQVEAGSAATLLFQDLRTNEATKSIPIVFLATTGVPQVEQGGGVLLRRPFGAGALVGAVQKAMNSSK